MSNDNFTLQVSFKTKSNTLVNLRAEDEPELAGHLESMKNIIPMIDDVEELLAAMRTVYAVMGPDRGGSGGGNYSKPAAQAAPAQAAPAAPASGHGKSCLHGEKIYKTGISKKTGNPYARYDCPKGECPVEWGKAS